jgi:hypothetical protein
METNVVSVGYDAVLARRRSPTLQRLWRETRAASTSRGVHINRDRRGLTRMAGLAGADGVGGSRLRHGRGRCGSPGTPARVPVSIDFDGGRFAGERAQAALGFSDNARFALGTFAESGSTPQSRTASPARTRGNTRPTSAPVREAARSCAPAGGCVHGVRADPEGAAGLPVLGTDTVADYRPLMVEAGFDVDVYEEVPGWPEPMSRAYRALLDAKEALVREMGEAAFGALSLELALTLDRQPYRRRVLACATRG